MKRSENCSVRSEAIYIDDMESPEGNEMAKLSPRVDIKSRKQQNNKEENRGDHEGKNEEEDSEESRKEVTERKTTIWKMLMVRILFKKLPQVVIAKSVR